MIYRTSQVQLTRSEVIYLTTETDDPNKWGKLGSLRTFVSDTDMLGRFCSVPRDKSDLGSNLDFGYSTEK